MRSDWLLVLGVLCPTGLPLTGCSSSSASDGNMATLSDGQAALDDAGCAAFDGKLDSVQVAAGKTLVAKWQCASCHEGEKGTLAGGMLGLEGGVTAYPPNLTPDQATGLGCWTDQEIERAMSVGIDNEGVPLCVMPQFTLDSGSMGQIVQYLRSLPPVANQVPDTNCP